MQVLHTGNRPTGESSIFSTPVVVRGFVVFKHQRVRLPCSYPAPPLWLASFLRAVMLRERPKPTPPSCSIGIDNLPTRILDES